MTSLLKRIQESYYYIAEEITDPRTKGLLFGNPACLFTVVAGYLFFCCKWGPRYMRDRKPFDLTKILIVYNIFQVLLSTYIFVGALHVWFTSYNWTCQPVDEEINPATIQIHKYVWWYYFGKLTELLDTVFFVLRKKNKQVTLLHLYHHASMPIFTYFGMRYYPNGHGTLFGVFNCFVHIVMYTYYLIAGLGPQFQKYLWWKKHVTIIQLIQFVAIFLHNFPQLFTSCSYPKHVHLLLVTDSILFFYLFSKFYFNTYIKRIDINGNAVNGKQKVRIE